MPPKRRRPANQTTPANWLSQIRLAASSLQPVNRELQSHALAARGFLVDGDRGLNPGRDSDAATIAEEPSGDEDSGVPSAAEESSKPDNSESSGEDSCHDRIVFRNKRFNGRAAAPGLGDSDSDSASESASDPDSASDATHQKLAKPRARRQQTKKVHAKKVQRKQSQGKQLHVRLSAVERKKIARERKLSARSNTVKAYEGSLKRFDWFLEHDDQGNKRAKPYNGNMVTAKNGVDVAVRFIQWVGQNFPGHEWPKKASELKLKVLEAMHSGLQSRYSEQLMALRAEQRSQVLVRKLGDDANYKAVYTTIKNRLSEKGKRPSGDRDPQDNTAEDTLNSHHRWVLPKRLPSGRSGRGVRPTAVCVGASTAGGDTGLPFTREGLVGYSRLAGYCSAAWLVSFRLDRCVPMAPARLHAGIHRRRAAGLNADDDATP
ncbi:g10093 [Coccomyxa elongata]